eukprot:TRINITY_DN16845_c0_g1_i2.p1 TRINITY_DN16845_c0_g1~~TRINITY_DN16845_c0_g1_i2.p1  ORF type:complete len:357 (+),score=115.09 TRINITY_DN16845_c0_g1_i2:2-1072(+)
MKLIQKKNLFKKDLFIKSKCFHFIGISSYNNLTFKMNTKRFITFSTKKKSDDSKNINIKDDRESKNEIIQENKEIKRETPRTFPKSPKRSMPNKEKLEALKKHILEQEKKKFAINDENFQSTVPTKKFFWKYLMPFLLYLGISTALSIYMIGRDNTEVLLSNLSDFIDDAINPLNDEEEKVKSMEKICERITNDSLKRKISQEYYIGIFLDLAHSNSNQNIRNRAVDILYHTSFIKEAKEKITQDNSLIEKMIEMLSEPNTTLYVKKKLSLIISNICKDDLQKKQKMVAMGVIPVLHNVVQGDKRIQSQNVKNVLSLLAFSYRRMESERGGHKNNGEVLRSNQFQRQNCPQLRPHF